MDYDDPDVSMSSSHMDSNSIRAYGSPSIRRSLRRGGNSTSRSPRMNRQSRRRISSSGSIIIRPSLRWTTNVTSLLSALLFTGIIFGWAPLKLILVREGQYQELCTKDDANDENDEEDDSDIPCTAQMDRYNAIFTLAQFFLSFASLPVGFFLDHAPKTIHYLLAATLQIAGLALFGMSDTRLGRDYFLVGYSLMALGGCMTMLGAFPASFLLPHQQAAILAAISCLFDASSIIFAIFERLNLYNATLFSRQDLFLPYTAVALVIYSILVLCWWHLEKKKWQTVVERENQADNNSNNNNNHLTADDTLMAVPADADNGENNPNAISSSSTTTTVDTHVQHVRRLGMHDWSLRRQLGTLEFALVLIFASVHMLRCNFYIEAVNEILVSMGDDNATYARIFSFVLPVGIIFVPFIEATVRRLGVVGTLHFTNILGVLFGIMILIPSLYVQAVAFFVFACFRAYLYATLNTFIAVTFGLATMGRVIGSTFTTAAVVTLLQYPAAAMAETRYDNDFTVINGIMLGLCALPIAFAVIYSQTEKREQPGQRDESQPLVVAESATNGT